MLDDLLQPVEGRRHRRGIDREVVRYRLPGELGQRDLVGHGERQQAPVEQLQAELVAALILLDIAPPPAARRLKRVEHHDEPAWSKPLDVQLWIGECLKH